MKNNFKYLALFAAAAVFVSCENEFDDSVANGDVYTTGEADFSKYVSVGNSLTSGYADNALYLEGQQNSFPNIMAQQFELVGGGEFNQPLVNDNLGGLLLGGTQILPNRLVLAVGASGPGPARLAGTPTTDVTNKFTGPLNNYGVPGARVFHLAAPGYGSVAGVPAGTANPYYARFSTSESSTVIDDAAAADGTFFTLWIGNNDILGYASSGGSGVDNNETGQTSPALQGDNSITNNNTFAGVYASLVAKMTANGAKGALINIPDLTSLPFFTTVPSAPFDPRNPTFAAQIPSLNAFYAELNQAFTAFGVPERRVTFSTTAASPAVVFDETLADITQQLTAALTPRFGPAAGIVARQFGQIRPATSADLLTLSSSSVLGTINQARFTQLTTAGLPPEVAGQLSANGLTFALQDQFTLTPDEQARITRAQTSYNATIAALAQANGLAFADARTALQGVAQGGVAFNGGILTSTYVTGGGFSLDGVHPTPRGYAFTANFILNAINATYGSTIPTVDIGNYKTIQPSNNVQ
jgi:lysophospholipase L1-like esterase